MRREQDRTNQENTHLHFRGDSGLETLDLSTVDVLELERDAIYNVFRTQVEAARELRVDTSQLNRWLSGKEQFPLQRLVKHGRLRREFVRLLNERSGDAAPPKSKYNRLWLITAKAVRVVATKFERELEREVRSGNLKKNTDEAA